jgi:tetratricopeptide (TPR) repeat protein
VGTGTPLRGRSRDVAELTGVLREALDGSGGLALLVGEPGIGKSWLAAQIATRARAEGAAVAWAGCPAGTASPYWPWRQLMAALAPQPVPAGLEPLLLPVQLAASDDPEADRLALVEAVVSSLRASVVPQPLVAVVDDLHWADTASVRLLAAVAPTLRGLPLLLIATTRGGGTEPAAGDLIDDLGRHGRRLDLVGLSVDEVAALGGELAGARLAPDVAEAVHRATGGNALFACELIRLIDGDGGRLGIAGPGGVPTVPQGVRTVLHQRLDALPSTTTELLDVAAVIGEQFRLDVLQQVTGLDAPALVDRLEPAVSERLVRFESPGRYAFAHALISAAITDRLGHARRIRAHEIVGLALEELADRGVEVDPAVLAHHWFLAAPAGNAERAVRYACAAAQQAEAMLAHERAVEHYDDALEVLATAAGAGDRAELLIARAESLVAAGDLPGSRHGFEEAAAVARVEGRPDLLARAALGLGAGAGGFEIALLDRGQIDLLEESLGALGEEPTPLRALVLGRLSVALAYSAPPERRLALAEEAVAIARRCGEPASLAHALAAHCDAISGPADNARRLDQAAEIIALAITLGDRRLELLGRRLRLVALLERGDTARADAEIEAYERVAVTLRQPLYLWYVPLWRGMRALAQGDVTTVETCYDEAARLGRQAGSHNALLLTEVLRFALLAETDPARSGEVMQQFLELTPVGLGSVHWLNAALAAIQTGDSAGARPMFERAVRHLSDIPVDAEWMAVLFAAVEVLRLSGPHPIAPTLYEWLLDVRHLHTIDGIGAADYGSAERQLGVLAGLLGRQDDARAHMAAALEANERAGHRLAVARTLADVGAVLGDAEVLSRARHAYRRLGLHDRALQLPALPGDHVADPPGAGAAVLRGTVRRDGSIWALSFAGSTVHVDDRKGLHDLVRLLGAPGTDIHVLELATPATAEAGGPPAGLGVQGDLGPLLDGTARAAYRRRLAELEEEVADAHACADSERAARASAERDALVAQLASALGLGGRPRRAGDPVERARSTVTRRIREAIGHVERAHPDLGRHLRHAVRTGAWCRYEPEQPVHWELPPLTS